MENLERAMGMHMRPTNTPGTARSLESMRGYMIRVSQHQRTAQQKRRAVIDAAMAQRPTAGAAASSSSNMQQRVFEEDVACEHVVVQDQSPAKRARYQNVEEAD